MKILIKNYTFVILFTAVTVLAGAVLIFSLSENHPPYQEIVVQEGDSLWSIAEKYHQLNGMNEDDFIIWVQKENQLVTAMIKPGDVLIIPVASSSHVYSDHQVAFKEE